jgi:ATPase subunit of ABC transporter with duplicated ATPase domains
LKALGNARPACRDAQPARHRLAVASDDAKSKAVIVADHVTKTFGEGAGARAIIKDFSLRITRRDRIGVVGANGAGKTTLLKLLTGELQPDSGTVTLAKTLSGVMIDQQRSLMSPEKRVRDVLAEGGDWIDVRGERKHIQGYLKDFLFDPASSRRASARCRAANARVCCSRANSPASPTCWCWTSRPTTSTSKRSICCRK